MKHGRLPRRVPCCKGLVRCGGHSPGTLSEANRHDGISLAEASRRAADSAQKEFPLYVIW